MFYIKMALVTFSSSQYHNRHKNNISMYIFTVMHDLDSGDIKIHITYITDNMLYSVYTLFIWLKYLHNN